MKSKRGGTRPGSGRPKGAINRATQEAKAKAKETGELPLDFMLRIMRDDGAEMTQRLDMAKAAAPYIHAKLSAIEVSNPEGESFRHEFTWLS